MITVPRQILDAMVAHCVFMAPEEACGLLASDSRGELRMAYPATNRDRSPSRYTVDPTEHFWSMRHAERNGWTLSGVFHSHPKTEAYPSPADVTGALDPDWVYFIIGLRDGARPEVRAFSIREGHVQEAPLRFEGLVGRRDMQTISAIRGSGE